jgi:hypothetical protein
MNGRKANDKILKSESKIKFLKPFSLILLSIDIISFSVYKVIDIISFSEYLQSCGELIFVFILAVLLFFSILKNKTKILQITCIVYLVLGMTLFFILLYLQLEHIHMITLTFNIISGIARMLCGIFMLVLTKSMIKLENSNIN